MEVSVCYCLVNPSRTSLDSIGCLGTTRHTVRQSSGADFTLEIPRQSPDVGHIAVRTPYPRV